MTDAFRPLKNAFARYATGVTVVSVRDGQGVSHAITVNSFTSVSLDPTLVLWCIDKRTSLFDLFTSADHYAVSVLASDQQELSNRFATPGRHEMTSEDGAAAVTGALLLNERLAGFDCKMSAQHDAGDHVILVGEVAHFDSRPGAPLLYVGRGYHEGAIIQDPT